MQYSAFLGHQPQISVAELSSAIEDFSLKEILEERIAVFDSMEELDQDFLDTLGGTILIAKRITEENLEIDDIPKILLNEVPAKRGKVTFSLRAVGIPKQAVRGLYKKCKIKFKESGRGCRYTGNDKKPAHTAILHKEGLIEGKTGCELAVIMKGTEDEKTLWIGRTIAAHDIDKYTRRDMQKPVRDTTVGLLPPKLAQVMLNFGKWLVNEGERGTAFAKATAVKKGKGESDIKKKKTNLDEITILDPFCGTGVIPMEALLRGWNVFASDVSLKAVNGCNKNIEWLRKEEKIFKKDVPSEVFKHDALKPFELTELPDVIVTETSLGPPLTDRPNVKDVGKMKTQSEKLQIAFLENAAKTLPGVPIVCAWPAWRQKGGWVHLEKVWSAIDSLGYLPMLPPSAEPHNPKHLSLFYCRSDQFVGREMVLLKARKKS